MKPLIIVIFFTGSIFGKAQQNVEFKAVKDYYDYQRLMIGNEFKKKLEKEPTAFNKDLLKSDFILFMTKMDSIQNTALIGALISVKNREDLSKKSVGELSEINIIKSKEIDFEKIAEYPGGLNIMRQHVSGLFYTSAVKSNEKTVKTNVEFIVEKDGSVSSVHANGDNFTFNRQAEIAMYLLPEKFSPAKINGEYVRYRYKLPLSMNLE